MKKKIYEHKGKHFTLDDEEQEIMDAYEAGELIPVKNQAAEIAKAVEIAKNTNRKDEVVTFRLSKHALVGLKVNAAREGIPYQTLLGSLIHKYNTGQLRLDDRAQERYETSHSADALPKKDKESKKKRAS